MTSPTGPGASPSRLGAFAVGVHVEGATPVDPDEAADLIPMGIETVDQLNAFKQTMIPSATEWALRNRRRRTPAQVLSEAFLFNLHRQMFDEMWRWAGAPRRTDKNIGVHWPTIRVALRERVKDAQLWLAESFRSTRSRCGSITGSYWCTPFRTATVAGAAWPPTRRCTRTVSNPSRGAQPT